MKCKIRDLEVNYEVAGTGRPVLVLHGGAIGNAKMAMAAIEPLFEGRAGWRRFYPDLPGHGETPTPQWLHGHDDLLDIVVRFSEAVVPAGGRWVVIGWSWGGYVARGFVHHRLPLIDGVMLYVPKMQWGGGGTPTAIRHDGAYDAALRPGEEWMAGVLAVQTLPLLAEMRTHIARHARPVDPAASAALDASLFSFDPDVLPAPSPAPALIVTGRQDAVEGYRQAWPVIDNFPRGTYAVLDRAGHVLGLEQPALFRALGGEWLDRVDEYVGGPARD